jgi:hypothetical protein
LRTAIEQYNNLGVDEFARKYVFSGGAELENPAIAKGNLVYQVTRQNGQASALAAPVAEADIQPHQLAATGIQSGPARSNGGHQTLGPVAPNPLADPAVVQCIFPADPRPLLFFGTRLGRIIVVDPATGQWMHIGFALPPQIFGSAWIYSAGGVFYDVYPNGAIAIRGPFGPQQVGYAIRVGT